MLNLSGPGTTQTSQWVKGCCLCFKRGTWWPSGRSLHNSATRMATLATAIKQQQCGVHITGHHLMNWENSATWLTDQATLQEISCMKWQNRRPSNPSKALSWQSYLRRMLLTQKSMQMDFALHQARVYMFFAFSKWIIFQPYNGWRRGQITKLWVRTCYSISVELQMEMCKWTHFIPPTKRLFFIRPHRMALLRWNPLSNLSWSNKAPRPMRKREHCGGKNLQEKKWKWHEVIMFTMLTIVPQARKNRRQIKLHRFFATLAIS